MIKAKIMKCAVSTIGTGHDGLQDYQVERHVNGFCAEHDVVNIKVSADVPKRHNNGGFDQFELW